MALQHPLIRPSNPIQSKAGPRISLRRWRRMEYRRSATRSMSPSQARVLFKWPTTWRRRRVSSQAFLGAPQFMLQLRWQSAHRKDQCCWQSLPTRESGTCPLHFSPQFRLIWT
ncbi:unnamed protein product, partial [Symbiodinium sp. KB8]